MENEETGGLTFGEICRIVLKRIWYVLGATVAVALIAALVVYLAVNPAQRWYSMQFNLIFPTGSEYSYPDGEPFFYQEMISKNFLADVIKTEGLESVDIDHMIREDDIEIAAETVTENGEARYSGRFTLRVKSSYFSGERQAEEFIRAVAQEPVTRMCREAGDVSYAVAKEAFELAPFEERLNLLSQEREAILEKYDEWIKTYDASYRLTVEVKDGEAAKSVTQSLKDFRASVTALFGESVQKGLESELENGGYYYTDNFKAYTDKLKAEYARNKTEIEALKTASGAQPTAISLLSAVTIDGETSPQTPAAPTVSQRLASLIERNNKILHWLGSDALGESGNISATLSETGNNEFTERLEAERGKLEEASALLTAVTQAIYNRGMSARFDIQSVETAGGTSVILVAVAAAIVTFLVASVAAYMIEASRKKKAPAGNAEAPKAPEENGTSEETHD